MCTLISLAELEFQKQHSHKVYWDFKKGKNKVFKNGHLIPRKVKLCFTMSLLFMSFHYYSELVYKAGSPV